MRGPALWIVFLTTEFFSQCQQPLRGAGVAIEDDILANCPQLRIDIIVNDHLSGIDDAHIHAGFDGMIKEYRVHGLAHRFVATERERQIRDAA